MPITSIGSFIPVMEEFAFHWAQANAAIAPAVLVLRGGYGLADFVADQATIQSAITAVEDVDNDRQIAQAQRDESKAAHRARLAQYRAIVLGVLAGTPYAETLPLLPRFIANTGEFLEAMDEMANGWNRINTDPIPGFTGPQLLAGGYSLADFSADLAALKAAYTSATNAEDNAQQQRRVRDALLAPAKQRMLQYRQAAKGFLPAGSPLLKTIPAVTPPPGATPAPVSATGVWNEATRQADLTWTASTNPNLAHYSVRTAPGPKYRAAEESVVAEVSAGTTAYSTNEGLSAPGATALFRVYVVLRTENERGSNTVRVTRDG